MQDFPYLTACFPNPAFLTVWGRISILHYKVIRHLVSNQVSAYSSKMGPKCISRWSTCLPQIWLLFLSMSQHTVTLKQEITLNLKIKTRSCHFKNFVMIQITSRHCTTIPVHHYKGCGYHTQQQALWVNFTEYLSVQSWVCGRNRTRYYILNALDFTRFEFSQHAAEDSGFSNMTLCWATVPDVWKAYSAFIFRVK